MGRDMPPLYGASNFYEKKLAQANKQIARWEQVKKLCEKELAEVAANKKDEK